VPLLGNQIGAELIQRFGYPAPRIQRGYKMEHSMDESSVSSAKLDQTDRDCLVHEVPDEIVEAAAEALNVCRMTFGGFPTTTVACCAS
jgi:hypothetical protein